MEVPQVTLEVLVHLVAEVGEMVVQTQEDYLYMEAVVVVVVLVLEEIPYTEGVVDQVQVL